MGNILKNRLTNDYRIGGLIIRLSKQSRCSFVPATEKATKNLFGKIIFNINIMSTMFSDSVLKKIKSYSLNRETILLHRKRPTLKRFSGKATLSEPNKRYCERDTDYLFAPNCSGGELCEQLNRTLTRTHTLTSHPKSFIHS